MKNISGYTQILIGFVITILLIGIGGYFVVSEQNVPLVPNEAPNQLEIQQDQDSGGELPLVDEEVAIEDVEAGKKDDVEEEVSSESETAMIVDAEIVPEVAPPTNILEPPKTVPQPEVSEADNEKLEYEKDYESLDREITVLHADGNIIGADRYTLLNDRLQDLVNRGLPTDDYVRLSDMLGVIYSDLQEEPPVVVMVTDVADESELSEEVTEPEAPSYLRPNNFLDYLPDCTNVQYTHAPTDLTEVYEISPLGNIGPPGHTLPTEHTYLHIQPGGTSDRTVPLYAPGDIRIINVSSDADGAAPGRDEYVIAFALCKDVLGYFNHVKGISDELKNVLATRECAQWSSNPGNICSKDIFYKVDGGTVIGEVGHQQGNFDFGTYDYRVKNAFVNSDRYGDTQATGFNQSRSLSIVCPYDYYGGALKDQLYDKILRTGAPQCGKVMYDVAGTLQGNWFVGGEGVVTDGSNHLAFIQDFNDPKKSIISIGGTFTTPKKLIFIPDTSGVINRAFTDVIASKQVYCYRGDIDGRILVRMLNTNDLWIEHQEGTCMGGESMINPTLYKR